jgi:hypothetical protein
VVHGRTGVDGAEGEVELDDLGRADHACHHLGLERSPVAREDRLESMQADVPRSRHPGARA